MQFLNDAVIPCLAHRTQRMTLPVAVTSPGSPSVLSYCCCLIVSDSTWCWACAISFASYAAFKNYGVCILSSCCRWLGSHRNAQMCCLCFSLVGSAESQRWARYRGPSFSLSVSLLLHSAKVLIWVKFIYKCVLTAWPPTSSVPV